MPLTTRPKIKPHSSSQDASLNNNNNNNNNKKQYGKTDRGKSFTRTLCTPSSLVGIDDDDNTVTTEVPSPSSLLALVPFDEPLPTISTTTPTTPTTRSALPVSTKIKLEMLIGRESPTTIATIPSDESMADTTTSVASDMILRDLRRLENGGDDNRTSRRVLFQKQQPSVLLDPRSNESSGTNNNKKPKRLNTHSDKHEKNHTRSSQRTKGRRRRHHKRAVPSELILTRMEETDDEVGGASSSVTTTSDVILQDLRLLEEEEEEQHDCNDAYLSLFTPCDRFLPLELDHVDDFLDAASHMASYNSSSLDESDDEEQEESVDQHVVVEHAATLKRKQQNTKALGKMISLTTKWLLSPWSWQDHQKCRS